MRQGIPSCCLALIAVIGLVATAGAQQAAGPADVPASAGEGSPATRAAEPAAAANPTDVPQPAKPAPGRKPASIPQPAEDELADRPILPEAEPAEPTGQTVEPRLAAYERMLDLVDEKRYEEAVDAAREVVRLTEEEFGPESLELASPVDNLATVQMLNGELVGAEGNYQRSIALIKRREGILSDRLINPYIGLGATYNRAGLYEQAREAFAQALRINHVNEGFYNDDQFKIRDGLTESYIGLQEYEDANFQQEIQVEIQKRKLGEDNPDLAPGMYKLARWYERTGQVDLARAIYQSTQRILRKTYGKDDAVLVDALEGISSTYERQGLLAESARALKNALKILDNAEEPDHARRGDILVRLGDLYTGDAKSETARAYYEDAWQELSVREQDLEKRDEYFAQPARIAGVSYRAMRFGPGVSADSEDLRDGSLLLQFNVDERGRAGDIIVVESDPEGLIDSRMMNIVARSWFRPRMEDGRAVATEGILLRHDYRYRPSADTMTVSDSAGEPLERPGDNGDDATRRAGGRLERPE